MSELTSMVGVFLIVGCLVLIVWLDYKGVSKAKKAQDEVNKVIEKIYKYFEDKANSSHTLEEVENSLLLMDKELHEENGKFKYPTRHSDFRACYAYLKGKRAILIKLQNKENNDNN